MADEMPFGYRRPRLSGSLVEGQRCLVATLMHHTQRFNKVLGKIYIIGVFTSLRHATDTLTGTRNENAFRRSAACPATKGSVEWVSRRRSYLRESGKSQAPNFGQKKRGLRQGATPRCHCKFKNGHGLHQPTEGWAGGDERRVRSHGGAQGSGLGQSALLRAVPLTFG